MKVFVTGTGTEVGKTFVTCTLMRELRARGRVVLVRKPIESFDADDQGPRDSELLADAAGCSRTEVCDRQIPLAMAPPRAAALLGMPPVLMSELVAAVPRHTEPSQWVFVEGAGGIASPIADDGDNRDFLDVLDPDITIVVADAGLGTVNACTLAHAYLDARPHFFFLNRYDASDPLHVDNRALVERLAPTAHSVRSCLNLLIP